MPRLGLAASALAALLALSRPPSAWGASLSGGGGEDGGAAGGAAGAAVGAEEEKCGGEAAGLDALGPEEEKEEEEEEDDEDEEDWKVRGRLATDMVGRLSDKLGLPGQGPKDEHQVMAEWLNQRLPRLAGMGVESWTGKPSFTFMMDTDYPPYAMWSSEIGRPDEAAGFGLDFAKAACDFCDFECDFIVDKWGKCWSEDNLPGDGLMNGHYHACMTYTNQYQRQWSLEFSHSILSKNKPGGLLSRLKADGTPVLDPKKSDLTGFKICDVAGWAPTIKTLSFSKNECDGGNYFHGYEIVIPEQVGPDAAMKMLLNGDCDGVYMYADMIEHKKPQKCDGCTWDPVLYSKLGTEYAWVHTGLNEHMANGTTLAMAKKHSKVASILNPCIADVIESAKYGELCQKYDLQSECFETPFVKKQEGDGSTCSYYRDSKGITADCPCDSGYCGCDGHSLGDGHDHGNAGWFAEHEDHFVKVDGRMYHLKNDHEDEAQSASAE